MSGKCIVELWHLRTYLSSSPVWGDRKNSRTSGPGTTLDSRAFGLHRFNTSKPKQAKQACFLEVAFLNAFPQVVLMVYSEITGSATIGHVRSRPRCRAHGCRWMWRWFRVGRKSVPCGIRPEKTMVCGERERDRVCVREYEREVTGH